MVTGTFSLIPTTFSSSISKPGLLKFERCVEQGQQDESQKGTCKKLSTSGIIIPRSSDVFHGPAHLNRSETKISRVLGPGKCDIFPCWRRCLAGENSNRNMKEGMIAIPRDPSLMLSYSLFVNYLFQPFSLRSL